jgi:hypothetical protein
MVGSAHKDGAWRVAGHLLPLCPVCKVPPDRIGGLEVNALRLPELTTGHPFAANRGRLLAAGRATTSESTRVVGNTLE